MPAGSRPPAFYFSDGGQEVIVSAAQVRAGAPDLPYTLTTVDVTTLDGTTSYSPATSCTRVANTVVSDLYTRPDGTTYTLAKGPGLPQGGAYDCVASGGTSTADWNLASQVVIVTGCGRMMDSWPAPICDMLACGYQGSYSATHTITRSDGYVVTSTNSTQAESPCTGSASWQVGALGNSGTGQQACAQWNPTTPNCSSHPSGTSVNSWRGTLGW